MLTALEHRILSFIQNHFAHHDQGPTLTEIGAGVGVQSKGTVHRYVQSLTDKGYLNHQGGWRAIRLADPGESNRLPLLGRIAAGRPIEAIPDQTEIDLNALFVGPRRYVLKVAGDSMVEAGILDGDLVIIERREPARDGDIVVALIDTDEVTIKRLKQHPDGLIELIPENRSMHPLIYFAERVQIQGVLIGQLRTYL